jgi:hypothetical protein
MRGKFRRIAQIRKPLSLRELLLSESSMALMNTLEFNRKRRGRAHQIFHFRVFWKIAVVVAGHFVKTRT